MGSPESRADSIAANPAIERRPVSSWGERFTWRPGAEPAVNDTSSAAVGTFVNQPTRCRLPGLHDVVQRGVVGVELFDVVMLQQHILHDLRPLGQSIHHRLNQLR